MDLPQVQSSPLRQHTSHYPSSDTSTPSTPPPVSPLMLIGEIFLSTILHSILPDLPEQLLNQLVSMTTDDVVETPPREMISDLSTLTPEDLERLEVVDDTIQQ